LAEVALRTSLCDDPVAEGSADMFEGDRTVIPNALLDALDDGDRLAVLADDDAAAAMAMLYIVELTAPFSSNVAYRSAWLQQVRALAVKLGDACPDDLEVRMLAAIARTAFAARATTAAQAASEHALTRAIEAGDLASQVLIRAQRLPFLAIAQPVEAARDARLLDASLGLLDHGERPPFLEAEVRLAHIAWYGAAGELNQMRKELAALGRLRLPKDDALSFIAYASHAALAQLYLRTKHRAQAALALVEAARLADLHGAWAEVANLQAVVAAIAMQATDFKAAVAHAQSAVAAAQQAICQHAQPDPWLGFPIDLGVIDSAGKAVHSLAESVLAAQDLSDSTGFLVAASAMGAFYLADDRALEALDALTEAADAARGLDDGTVVQTLRAVAEGLLGHLGILRA
jgi:hypothetical protein